MASGIFTQRQVQRELLKGSWVNPKVPSVEYLVIAGGGAGGNSIGGGGGAGGLLQGHISVASGTPITVTVGAGGSNNSGVNSAFSSIIATGGGRGGSYLDEIGRPGGSGGGGGARETSASNANGGTGIEGQGNAGGVGFPLSTNYPGAGGGGAGIIGRTAINNFAGVGGDGIASDISGNRTMYAGGGGGGTHPTGTAGTGGAGGGGAGTASGGGTGVAGTANLGGGGGGSTYNQANGGAGGSGVVIISYPDTYANAASQTNGTFSTSGSGSLSSSSGNYLYSSSSTNLNLGTSSFTVEYWVNFNSITGGPTPVCLGTAGGNPLFGNVNGGVLGLFLSGSSPPWDICNNATIGTVTTGIWYHVAIVRNGNTFYTFLNGVQGATFTSSQTIYQTSNVMGIGTGEGGVYPLNGYVTNVRLIKGTALYTSAFTPPTAPLTAITNTSILFNAVSGSAFADSSGNYLTFTATGLPTWNQQSPFPTGLGYKDRVYTWTSSGTITF